MNYSPKHNDIKMRAVYGFLIVLGLALNFVGEGLVKTVLSAVSLILLAVGLYLFVKHDMTTYTYILMENEGRVDFYIDRVVGKRGAYVCYFPISDCVCHGTFTDTTRSELNAKYNDCSFSKYVQNFMTGKRYFALFAHEGRHQCVVFEANEEMIGIFENFAGKRVIDGEIQVQEVENE